MPRLDKWLVFIFQLLYLCKTLCGVTIKLVECVERTVPLTYVNSLGFRKLNNTCGSASPTHFAFPKPEDPAPSPPALSPLCIQHWAHLILLVLKMFVCFEKLIHIHGKTFKQYKRVYNGKKVSFSLEASFQFPVPSPELIAVIYILCILSEQFYEFTTL